MGRYKNSVLIGGLGIAAFSFALVSPVVFSTGTSGNVQLDTEIATSIAMKIVSPNDVDPDCTPESGITYGEVNRYASSTGDNSGKMVDTFNGNEGEADEINTNTSCATLSMTPNTFDSTYSDVTVYTNSGTGYAVTLQSAENVSPNLVNVADSTQYIEAGALTESEGTVAGGQDKWAYKTDNGIITDWTAATTSPVAIKSYDTTTSGGDTTRVTYGISTGNNPTGKYTTTLTYTATMFDGPNPYVSKLSISANEGVSLSESDLSIPFGQSKTITVTPAEGYYLSSVTCPEGFTCTGYNTGIDYTGAQTITLKNNNSRNSGTVGFTTTPSDPWATCDATTTVGATCYSSGVEYIRLADGRLWTKNNQGDTDWYGASDECLAGTTLPNNDIFNNLLSIYGDGPNLYNATGWGGYYWSSTSGPDLEYGATAYYLNTANPDKVYFGDIRYKTATYVHVLCYR